MSCILAKLWLIQSTAQMQTNAKTVNDYGANPKVEVSLQPLPPYSIIIGHQDGDYEFMMKVACPASTR